MRNFGFDVRAGGPRRSQASSLRSRLLAALLARRRPGARARRGRARRPRSRPRTGATSPSATSHVRVQTASRNQRSWVTTSSDAAARGEVAREPVDALDVEVVGRLVEQQQLGVVEQQPRRARSGGARRRDSGAIARVEPSGKRAPRRRRAARRATSRKRGVGGPLVVGAAADELVADGAGRIEVVALAEQRDPQAAGARHARRRRAPPRRRSAAAASTCRRRCGRRPRSGRPRATPSVTPCSTVRAA